MGRVFKITLEGKVCSCCYCFTHLALLDDIISEISFSNADAYYPHPLSVFQSFQSGSGKAHLFDKVVNISLGEKEDHIMTTGIHTAVDIFCVTCGSMVGWKFESVAEKSQKYKEGKFILERCKLLNPDETE